MKQKGFVPIIILVLMALGIAGYFGYKYFKSTNKLFNYSTNTSPTSLATADPTASWKIYTNTSGFSIRYPTVLNADTTPFVGDPKNPSPDAIWMAISQTDENGPVENRLLLLVIKQNEPSYDLNTNTEIVLDGHKIKKLATNNTDDDKYLIKLNANKFLEVSVSTSPDRKALANQILSSFKFLGQGQNVTEEDAAKLVSNLPEIKDLLIKYPKYLIESDGLDQQKTSRLVHVYEIVDDHTATYDWYYVNINTGAVTKMVP